MDTRPSNISRGKSQPQMHFNLELLFSQLFFPTPPTPKQRRTESITFSHKPSNLTNEQNITVKLIRGLTATEYNVPHYPNHYYFPWLTFEAISMQAVWKVIFSQCPFLIFLLFCFVLFFSVTNIPCWHWGDQGAQGWENLKLTKRDENRASLCLLQSSCDREGKSQSWQIIIITKCRVCLTQGDKNCSCVIILPEAGKDKRQQRNWDYRTLRKKNDLILAVLPQN